MSDVEAARREAKQKNKQWELQARLVDRCGGAVYEFALALCGDPGDAEEILQQSFAEVLSAGQRTGGNGPPCRLLIGAAATRSLKRLGERQQEALGSPVGIDSAAENLVQFPVAPWRNLQGLYSTHERRRILHEALRTLSPLPRVAVLLHDRERFSLEETAQLLGQSLSAAGSCLLQGRLKLRNELDRFFRESDKGRG